MGGVSSDGGNAIVKLTANLESREQAQEEMKAVNAYYRKNGTLQGCPLLTPEDIAKLEAEMARSFRQSPKPYESFMLSNNNAENRRLFQEMGWTVHEGGSGISDTVTKDRQELYLHPTSFSGVLEGRLAAAETDCGMGIRTATAQELQVRAQPVRRCIPTAVSSDDSLRRMLYLASQRIVKHWHARCQNWDLVLSQLEILFAGQTCG